MWSVINRIIVHCTQYGGHEVQVEIIIIIMIIILEIPLCL